MSEELPAFGEMNYWDHEYKTGDAPKEWFVPYSTIREFVTKYIKPEMNILVLGCGTSSLSTEMYDEGYKNMESMDYSPEAIEEMKKARPEMVWKVMDVRNMPYEDNLFAGIVDKGTLDCLFFLDENNDNISKMLKEVSRVLKPGGRYTVVTCGHPMQRTDILLGDGSYNWKMLDWEEFLPPDEENFTHPSAYVYCLEKKKD